MDVPVLCFGDFSYQLMVGWWLRFVHFSIHYPQVAKTPCILAHVRDLPNIPEQLL